MFKQKNKIFYSNDILQNGFSLLITLFVMGICLAVILGIGAILFNSIKMIREIGDSVSAFYAADSGIEKTLYYDRSSKMIPENAKRGLCNICNSCSGFDCRNCKEIPQITDDGCEPEVCDDCVISYTSSLVNGRSFEIKIEITPEGETLTSLGSYKKLKRAIELTSKPFSTGTFGPRIISTNINPLSVPEGELIIIRAEIDFRGVEPYEVSAYIRRSNEVEPQKVVMELSERNDTYIYQTTWSGSEGAYYVDIEACDANGNCTIKENI